MHTADHIYPVLTIKNFVNQDGKPTTPHKRSTGIKSPVSNLCVLFFPCFVDKATAHVDTKALNMCHSLHESFWGILVGIPQHQ